MKKLFLILPALLLLLSACGNDEAYETIQISDIEAKQQEGYTVLDVREESEYDMGHIIGAENKPLTELQADNVEGLSEDKQYIVICQSGNRSKQASDILAKKGYDFVNVAQGMSSWNGDIEN
ncbi:rhodanese-like domain-containing protein [Paenisporosarcina cavernae]|uniref:Rhodanese-like domain-containing protein n=1 Tax=Paenisporosarcina cavernae TaxID=2320858 RepID=A0A385YRB0_9BACL|nr:rhodanese-like domain-containing protein [Paenisporosarcina cavernae]AYC28537.1 rhodanese-like domain-containing protein [Paenisporosarcina cavernae]